MDKVFYYDGKPDKDGEYLVILLGEQGPQEQPGWYFMVGDEPYGPYASEHAAAAAQGEVR